MNIDKRNGFDINNLPYIEEKADIFYHFGAFCKINQSIKYPSLTFDDNVKGTFNVLEFCRNNGIKKIMYASSSRVLSKEENPYTASKKYGENLIKAYSECYGIDYIIIRPSTVYGPCYDETGRALHNFIVNAFRNEELKIFGNKRKTLDFTYIDDFIDAIMLSHKKWNNCYNISGGERKVYDAAKQIIKEVNSKSNIGFYPAEIAQPQKVNVSNKEIRKLGFKPKIKLEEGIKRTVEWYKIHPNAWRYYIERRTFNGKTI
jgi:UDP-glucose 4-epimerase